MKREEAMKHLGNILGAGVRDIEGEAMVVGLATAALLQADQFEMAYEYDDGGVVTLRTTDVKVSTPLMPASPDWLSAETRLLVIAAIRANEAGCGEPRSRQPQPGCRTRSRPGPGQSPRAGPTPPPPRA